MKNLAFLLFFSLLSTYGLKAQVMHSSSAMEYSFGAERFSQFIAESVDLQSSGILPQAIEEIYRIRPVITGRYKKFKDTGDYYALGMSLGMSSWEEEVLVNDFSDFFVTVDPVLTPTIEQNQETSLGFFYHYSFLMNKEKMSNLQFFIGSGVDLNASFANKRGINSFFFSRLRRSTIGLRVSAIPELLYLIPNTRMTISLRTIIPLLDIQRVSADIRQPSFNSFIQSSTFSDNFQAAPIGLSRVELGFGYFLSTR